jgi:hypothetical protein
MTAPLSLWNISAAWVRHRLASGASAFATWMVRVLQFVFVRAADAVEGLASSQRPWTRFFVGNVADSRQNTSFANESLIAIADALEAVGRQFGSLLSSKSTVDCASSVPPSLSPQPPVPPAPTALRALFDLLRAAFRAVFGLLWRRRGALFRGALILALALSVAHRIRLFIVRSGTVVICVEIIAPTIANHWNRPLNPISFKYKTWFHVATIVLFLQTIVRNSSS